MPLHRGTGSRNVLAVAAVLTAGIICLLVFSLANPVFAAGSLSMSPTHGQPGTSITLSGTGFKSSATVKISFNDVSVASATTDGGGAFTAIFPAPSFPNGTYPVSAADGVNTVNTAFTIDPSSTNSTTSSSTTSSSTSNSTSSTSSSIKPTTVTTTVTTTSTTTATSTVTTTSKTTITTTAKTTVTTTSTTTVTSLSTSTTTRPAVTVTSTSTSTSTSTKNYTSTEAAATVTATKTLTQAGGAATVTVSVTKSVADPPAAQSSQPSGGFPDTLLYFLAGVGILVTAVSVGMLAFRGKRIEDYKGEGQSRGSSN
jgi:hypothetical protein